MIISRCKAKVTQEISRFRSPEIDNVLGQKELLKRCYLFCSTISDLSYKDTNISLFLYWWVIDESSFDKIVKYLLAEYLQYLQHIK